MNTTFKNEGTLREVVLKDFSITHGDMNEYVDGNDFNGTLEDLKKITLK